MFAGIYRSFLDKKDAGRGDMSEIADEVVKRIEIEILKMKRKMLSSSEIQEIALKILRNKAPDAFLRYLAYRESRDSKKLDKLLKEFY